MIPKTVTIATQSEVVYDNGLYIGLVSYNPAADPATPWCASLPPNRSVQCAAHDDAVNQLVAWETVRLAAVTPA